MKKRFFRLLILSGTVLTMLTACEYTFIEPTPAPPIIVGDTISYSQDIQPVFTSKCVSCHKTGGQAPDLSAGNSYTALTSGNLVVTGNPATSELYIVCKPSGSMANFISADQLNLIYRWINAGAKND
jgi:hypothetical protein